MQPDSSLQAEAPLHDLTETQRAKRELIFRSVIHLVSERGVANVSVKDVSADSGVALGTIYRLFASKEHMFAAALVRWAEPLAGRVSPVVEDMSEHLIATVRRGTRAYQRDKNLLAINVQSSASSDPYVSEVITEFRRSIRETLSVSLKGVPSDDADMLIDLVIAIWQDLLTHWYAGRRSMTDGLALAESQIRWAVAGMKADQARRSETGQQ
jgi:AcrR family transcriptional regulator